MKRRKYKANHLEPRYHQFGDLEIMGVSLGGVCTSIVLPQHKICFDVAQGLPFALSSRHYFLTHSHLDHAAGIPYLIAQRTMNSLPAGQFYMPEYMVQPLNEILNLWSTIEDHKYDFNFISANHGDQISVSNDNFVVPFRTFHRVTSNGYTLYQKIKKLKKVYTSLPQKELVELKESGTEINDFSNNAIFSFTGDTKIEFLESNSAVRSSKVLMLEVTYYSDKKTVDNAREWGHIHLDELHDVIDSIESEFIVLNHLSTRFTRKGLREEINNNFKKSDAERMHVF